MPFYVNTNRAGVPLVYNNGVETKNNKVIITFNNHAFRSTVYLGCVTVYLKFPIPATTSGRLPVEFETNGTTIKLTNKSGEEATTSDIGIGNNVYITLFYNKSDNTLLLI